jgi:hypothetical protein
MPIEGANTSTKEIMRSCVLLLALLTLPMAPLVAGERVDVRVKPLVAFAPADLQVQASFPADQDNRALQIIAESHNFYSSSEIHLEGEKGPTTTTVEFRSVPVGLYSVRVVVKGTGGKEIASARTEVNIVGR